MHQASKHEHNKHRLCLSMHCTRSNSAPAKIAKLSSRSTGPACRLGLALHARGSSSAPKAARLSTVQVHAFAPDASVGRSSHRAAGSSSSLLAQHLKAALSLPEAAASTVAEQLDVHHQLQMLHESGRLQSNVVLLRELCGTQAGQVVTRSPGLLAADLGTWVHFLDAYGVPVTSIVKICSDAPELFIRAGIHTAGTAILFFKGHGYTDGDITKRIVGYYPTLLACDLESEIQPVVRDLEAAGCSGPDLRLLIWEFPRIFNKDFRRHMKKFQYLSMYGLSARSLDLSNAERMTLRHL